MFEKLTWGHPGVQGAPDQEGDGVTKAAAAWDLENSSRVAQVVHMYLLHFS